MVLLYYLCEYGLVLLSISYATASSNCVVHVVNTASIFAAIFFYIYQLHIKLLYFQFCIIHWQRPMGLLALLDEESRFPRATDLSLAGRIT